MKRANEFLVGLVVIVAVVLVVAGALWLSETHLGAQQAVRAARFRTVGGLKVGDPVTLRGVRVGRIQAIRLAGDNWVETDLLIYDGVELPAHPAVIAASASLFGEWAATIVSYDEPQDDPNVRVMLAESMASGKGKAWPGATLPDVGQLTAQASRIAGDIATLTGRIQQAFDSNTVQDLRQSIQDFSHVVGQLNTFTRAQTSKLDVVTGNVQQASNAVNAAAGDFRTVMGRVDSATGNGQLQAILNHGRSATTQIDSASQDIRQLTAALRDHEENLTHILVATDSLMSKLAKGQGTIGKLATDSTLYHETTETVLELRRLIADIQANPRKYFKFSVF
ncbi:MAG: MlaD family protein [Gemmatimonadales bacterium]